MKKYRTTFGPTRYFIGGIIFWCVALFVMGIIMGELLFIFLASALTGYILAIRFRLWISIADEGFVYQGLFTKWQAKWSDVSRFKNMKSYGWPKDRMYGQDRYQLVLSNGNKRVISFLFFPGQCLAEIKLKMKGRNRTSA